MKKKLLSILILCFCMLNVTQTFAQSLTIKGTVTSKADGLPIPGVSVKVQGSTVGTLTSVEGKFTVQASANSVLIFSFIGYSQQSVPLAGKTSINVILESKNDQLDEVVVTGVGVATKKSQVAIDVAAVDSKDFAASAITNAAQSLTGQIAGVQIIQQTSQPGAAPLIILRGYTNLASPAPLVLIDGIQATSDILSTIDPNIVDHIEVVKGSAGGMLYGAKGGNGVIQIFTKKGAKNGKLTIDISSKYSNDRIIELNDIVAKMNHFVEDASGNLLTASGAIVAPNADGIYPAAPAQEPFATQPTVVQNNQPYNVPTYDHIQQANHVANTFTNSINIRGGSDKVDYAFGVSNLQQQDVFSNMYNRTNMNFNFGFSPAKGLTIRNNAQIIYSYDNLLSSNRFGMLMAFPFINFDYIDPNTGRHVIRPDSYSTDGLNPLAEREVHTHYDKSPRLVENFNVNYKFPKFVELDAKFSEDARNVDSYDLYSNQTGLPQTLFYGPNIGGYISDANENARTEYGNVGMYIRTDFKNDFHINLPIKTTTQVTYDYTATFDHAYNATGSVLPPFPPYTITTTSGAKTAGESYSQSLLYGYLVNQTIDYANLVGISAGFRSDYSSQFGAASHPFTFPRATVYFNPSELLNAHELIYNWKVRGAYGEAGVQPGTYSRQVTLGASTYGAANSLTALVTPTTASNPNLAVQVTKELELGTDITVTPLKNSDWLSSITFTGTYYHRSSDDDIQTAPLPPSAGYTGISSNLVSLTGHGIELSLDINAYKSENFTWYTGSRFAISKTYVASIAYNIPVTSSIFTLTPGQELGTIMTQSPLHSITQVNPATGAPYIAPANDGNYVMVNGNVVNKTTYAVQLTSTSDLGNQGNVNPNFTSSFINRFTIYKKLNLSFQFDWNHGGKIYNGTRQYLARDGISSDFDKNVTINGNTGSYVAYWQSYYNALNPLSSFVEDGSFIRLRDLSLSYDITSLVHQKWLRSLVFTASGRNLLTFTKYSGLDPEVSSAVNPSTGGGLSNIGSYQGVDFYAQPNLKSYQFGFNIGF